MDFQPFFWKEKATFGKPKAAQGTWVAVQCSQRPQQSKVTKYWTSIQLNSVSRHRQPPAARDLQLAQRTTQTLTSNTQGHTKILCGLGFPSYTHLVKKTRTIYTHYLGIQTIQNPYIVLCSLQAAVLHNIRHQIRPLEFLGRPLGPLKIIGRLVSTQKMLGVAKGRPKGLKIRQNGFTASISLAAQVMEEIFVWRPEVTMLPPEKI